MPLIDRIPDMAGQWSKLLYLADNNRIRFRACLLVLFFLLWTPGHLQSCPFCPPVSSTLTEDFEKARIVVLAEWDQLKQTEEKYETTFRVIKVIRGDQSLLESKNQILIDEDYQGKKGDLFLLFSGDQEELSWDNVIPVSETSYQYILQAPGLESETKVRLKYFIRFLEFPESLLANDSFSEFAQASFEDVASLVDQYPVDKLRNWIKDKEVPVTRIGLYALMLGLSGNENDAEILKQRMSNLDSDFQIGLDGLMAGYVLLKGNEGLNYLNEKYLSRKDASSSETYAAMKALRFLYQYASDRVDREQVKASMRLMLDRSAMTELVIIDLTRWKDWSLSGQLMKMYSQPEHDNRQTRRAILRHLLLFREQKPSDPSLKEVDEFLLKAQESDPKAYREAELLLKRNSGIRRVKEK